MLIQSVLTLGMQILVSQKLGKGKLDEAIGIFSLAMSMTVGLLSCVMLISLIFPEQVADMLGADKSLGAVRQETIDYVQASSLGLPAIAAVTILSPIMQLDGDKKRAVTAVTILSVSNVIGDLIAIFLFWRDNVGNWNGNQRSLFFGVDSFTFALPQPQCNI